MAPADGLQNITMAAWGWGTIATFCNRVEYGFDVIAAEDTSRTHRTMYPRNIVVGSFSVGLIFRNHDEFQQCMDLLNNYIKTVTDPDNVGVSPMLVSVPLRDFQRIGIPTQGFIYGDQVGRFTYAATINFEGAVDPIDPSASASTTANILADSEWLYPNVVGGSAEDALYNPTRYFGTSIPDKEFNIGGGRRVH